MSKVIDASVLVRAVVPGQPHHEETRTWLAAEDRLLAPRLLWYEVSSVLRHLEFLGLIDAGTCDRCLEMALRLQIRVLAPRHLYFEALRLARKLNVSRTWDVTYLALAVSENCPLVTMDGRLLRTAVFHGYDVRHPFENVKEGEQS